MTRTPIFFAATLGLLIPVAGCHKNPNAAAQVSGIVKYQNQPLKGGTITFHGKEATAFPAVIHEDGTYAITDIPDGEMKVTVETDSLNAKKAVYSGPGGRKEPSYDAPGLPPKPNEADRKEVTSVKLPLRYKDPESSGLSATLAKGKNKKDFELTD